MPKHEKAGRVSQAPLFFPYLVYLTPLPLVLDIGLGQLPTAVLAMIVIEALLKPNHPYHDDVARAFSTHWKPIPAKVKGKGGGGGGGGAGGDDDDNTKLLRLNMSPLFSLKLRKATADQGEQVSQWVQRKDFLTNEAASCVMLVPSASTVERSLMAILPKVPASMDVNGEAQFTRSEEMTERIRVAFKTLYPDGLLLVVAPRGEQVRASLELFGYYLLGDLGSLFVKPSDHTGVGDALQIALYGTEWGLPACVSGKAFGTPPNNWTLLAGT